MGNQNKLKMERNYIEIDAGQNFYMKEFMTELPHGILNKILTGCGGTTVAIDNGEDYIIAVPNVEMVINKKKSKPHLTVVYGSLPLIIDWSKPIKIMCTYDSLERICQELNKTVDVYLRFKLLIDEYQEFLTAYSYRSKIIHKKRVNGYYFL
jgi:hypothetical protein